MKCYRCGFDYSGSQCLICGKYAPTKDDLIGPDGNELRIAVIIPDRKLVSEETIIPLQGKAEHYHYHANGAENSHIYVYTPHQGKALFELLQGTENVVDRTILFNGRQRPYATDLWLPLLWFFTS